MHRRAWTWVAVALLVLGAVLFLSGPHETTFVMAADGSDLPTGIYWVPAYRLLGIAAGFCGLILLAAATAYRAGVRKERSTES